MSFRDDEARLRLKEVKVAARERALEGSVKGVAKHLEVTIASKCSFGKGQGILDAQHAEVEACLQGLAKQKGDWEHEEQNMEATLQQKEQEARERVQALEDRLVQRDFEVQRRMALSVKEVEALVAKEREKAVARQQELDERKRCSTSAIKKSTSCCGRSSSTRRATKLMEDRRRPRSASPRRLRAGRTRPCPSSLLVRWHPANRRRRRGHGPTGRTSGRRRGVEGRADRVATRDRGGGARRAAAAPDAAGVVLVVVVVVVVVLAEGLEDPPFADEPLASPCPSEAEAPGVVRSPVKRAEAPVSAPLGAPAHGVGARARQRVSERRPAAQSRRPRHHRSGATCRTTGDVAPLIAELDVVRRLSWPRGGSSSARSLSPP